MHPGRWIAGMADATSTIIAAEVPDHASACMDCCRRCIKIFSFVTVCLANMPILHLFDAAIKISLHNPCKNISWWQFLEAWIGPKEFVVVVVGCVVKIGEYSAVDLVV